MAYAIDPTVPPNSENPQNGATRIRNVSSELLQVLGYDGITAHAFNTPGNIQIDPNTGLFLIGAGPGAINLQIDPFVGAPTLAMNVIYNICYMYNPIDYTVVRGVLMDLPVVIVGAQSGSVPFGRDQTAAFGINTFYNVYSIGGNGLATSLVASLAFPPAGPTLPAGFTSWAFLGTFQTDSSGFVMPMYGRGNTMYYQANQSLLTNGTATSSTSVPIGSFVPINATQYELFISYGASAFSSPGDVFEYIGLVSGALNVTTSFYQVKYAVTTAAGSGSTWLEMPYITGGYFYALDHQTTGATLKTSHQVQGYRVPNGST